MTTMAWWCQIHKVKVKLTGVLPIFISEFFQENLTIVITFVNFSVILKRVSKGDTNVQMNTHLVLDIKLSCKKNP